jgi:hypothetical protein
MESPIFLQCGHRFDNRSPQIVMPNLVLSGCITLHGLIDLGPINRLWLGRAVLASCSGPLSHASAKACRSAALASLRAAVSASPSFDEPSMRMSFPTFPLSFVGAVLSAGFDQAGDVVGDLGEGIATQLPQFGEP